MSSLRGYFAALDERSFFRHRNDFQSDLKHKMNTRDMPRGARDLLRKLLACGCEIWLIGSRANGTARMNSDWDFFVFGNADVYEQLRTHLPIENIDLLVVTNGDEFASPWPREADGAIKRGSLTAWKWQQLTSDRASYEATKWPDHWGISQSALKIAK